VEQSNLQISHPDADSLTELADTMNRAFADYVVPVHVTADAMRALVARDDVRLEESYLARAAGDGPGIGLALTSIRGDGAGLRSRVAAMGVAPEGRGRGLARALLERQLADARARGSGALILECFTHNHRALPLYESAGFLVRRRLLSYEAATAALRRPARAPVHLRPAPPEELPALALRCQEVAPSWQLEATTLRPLGPTAQAYTIHVTPGEPPVGYLVCARPPDAAEARLVHIGILPDQRRQGLATAALHTWLAAAPGVARLTIPAILPEDMTQLRAWLSALGFTPGALAQFEMAAALQQ
jgi:ribosomal protein S18 acetylase RimI-like enzyme